MLEYLQTCNQYRKDCFVCDQNNDIILVESFSVNCKKYNELQKIGGKKLCYT